VKWEEKKISNWLIRLCTMRYAKVCAAALRVIPHINMCIKKIIQSYFMFVFMTEMWLDNFLYAYDNVAMQISMEWPLLSKILTSNIKYLWNIQKQFGYSPYHRHSNSKYIATARVPSSCSSNGSRHEYRTRSRFRSLSSMQLASCIPFSKYYCNYRGNFFANNAHDVDNYSGRSESN